MYFRSLALTSLKYLIRGDDYWAMETQLNVSSPPLLRPIPEVLKTAQREAETVSEPGKNSGKQKSDRVDRNASWAEANSEASAKSGSRGYSSTAESIGMVLNAQA